MYILAALYKFTPFEDPPALKAGLDAVCAAEGVTGTLLLAPEGLNGTIAGSRGGIDRVLAHLKSLPGCGDLDWKESTAHKPPFRRMKVRLKREIVTMGTPDVDPRRAVGRHVKPAEWNALIVAPDVAVIDTRNDYEVAIGTFEGAIDPGTKSFSEFPEWWARNKAQFEGKKIAMFCTGGIRCEKSTNFLLGQGVGHVYHLKGGILKYLEDTPAQDSTWRGSCFVFDGRVSVGHGLEEGPHILCHACRRPLLPEDRGHPAFEEGVSCHACIDETSDQDKDRFRERQRQIALARARGERHL